jgi:hypothetical protein
MISPSIDFERRALARAVREREAPVWIKRFALLLAVGLMFSLVMTAAAQDATPVPTAAGPSNALQANFFACTDSVIMTMTGSLLSGYSAFWQAFAGPGGTGTALTSVRQVDASGDFTYTERVANPAGVTTADGGTASAKVFVARSGNPAAIDFEFIVADINDGCSSGIPTGSITTSVDTGATSGGTTTGSNARNLLAPNGLVLNPNLRTEAEVVVGARPSDTFRSETPGLIFAECDGVPLALPGLVYDSDNVVVYWSWFTRTEEQMNQHLATALYSVGMNGATFNPVQLSAPVRRDGNWWVFYTAEVGNLRPGHYEVGYQLTWTEPVNDGFDDYGPGTDNPIETGTCNFDVRYDSENRASVSYTGMFNPTRYPVHNITPDY